jgi:hypothetical protein
LITKSYRLTFPDLSLGLTLFTTNYEATLWTTQPSVLAIPVLFQTRCPTPTPVLLPKDTALAKVVWLSLLLAWIPHVPFSSHSSTDLEPLELECQWPMMWSLPSEGSQSSLTRQTSRQTVTAQYEGV